MYHANREHTCTGVQLARPSAKLAHGIHIQLACAQIIELHMCTNKPLVTCAAHFARHRSSRVPLRVTCTAACHARHSHVPSLVMRAIARHVRNGSSRAPSLLVMRTTARPWECVEALTSDSDGACKMRPWRPQQRPCGRATHQRGLRQMCERFWLRGGLRRGVGTQSCTSTSFSLMVRSLLTPIQKSSPSLCMRALMSLRPRVKPPS